MQPDDANFNFELFYNSLGKKGYLIYPGKLTIANTFRIGCIGHLTSNDMYGTIKAVEETIKELKMVLKQNYSTVVQQIFFLLLKYQEKLDTMFQLTQLLRKKP